MRPLWCIIWYENFPHRSPRERRRSAPGKVLLALFLDFDIQQDERVHPEVRILTDAIVEAVWPPSVGEEDERDGLAKVVQLQTARADRVHDGRVVYDTRRDAERTGAEEDIGVRCRAERVADDEESDVPSVRIFQDRAAFCLDHFAVRDDQWLSIKLFLYGNDEPWNGQLGDKDLPGAPY